MAAPPDGRAGVPASAAGGPENKTAKLREILQDYSKLKRKAQLLKQSVQAEQEKNHKAESALQECKKNYGAKEKEVEELKAAYKNLEKKYRLQYKELQDMKASESGAGSSGWGFLGGGSGNANAKAMEDLKRTRRELESKLQENEELVMKMHEQKKEHEQTVTMLQNKLNSLKKAEKDRSDSEAALSREKDSQSALQIEEKENLEREISDAKATVALLQQQLRAKEEAMNKERSEYGVKVAELEEALRRRLPFLDNCNEKLHAFNVAPPMPSDDTNYHDLIYNGGLSLSLSLRSFCEFLEAVDARLQKQAKRTGGHTSPAVSAVLAKMAKFIPNHVQAVTSLRKALSAVLEELRGKGEATANYHSIGLAAFCTELTAFAESNKNFINLVLVHLREESLLPVCKKEMRERNQQLAASYLQFHQAVQGLVKEAVPLLMRLQKEPSTGEEEEGNGERQDQKGEGVELVQQKMEALEASLQILYRRTLGRVEHENMDAAGGGGAVAADIMLLNEQLTSTLASFTSFLSRCSVSLQALVASWQQSGLGAMVLGALHKPAKAAAENGILRQRAKRYLERIHNQHEATSGQSFTHDDVLFTKRALEDAEKEMISLKKEMQVHESCALSAVTERDRLRDELLELQDKVSERDHQLNLLRQELSRTKASMATSFANADGKSYEIPEAEHTFAEWTKSSTPESQQAAPKYQMTVMDEDGQVASSLQFKPEDEQREKELTEYHNKQMQQMRARVDEANERLLERQQQLEKAVGKLAQSKNIIETMQEESLAHEKRLKNLREDLDLTRNNYEDQIKMMTEHIVSMQEKLAIQEKAAHSDAYCPRCRTMVKANR